MEAQDFMLSKILELEEARQHRAAAIAEVQQRKRELSAMACALAKEPASFGEAAKIMGSGRLCW